MATVGQWNRVQRFPLIAGAGAYNFGKFEQVWCKGDKCMRERHPPLDVEWSLCASPGGGNWY